MIDILKKRHKIGDVVTLHTEEASFTGVIDAFEDTCVILSTDEGDEFIANDTIKRISVPKSTNTEKKEETKEEERKQDEAKPVIKEEVITEKVQEALPKIEYKVGDKIPLEELEKRTDKKSKPKLPKTISKGITLGSLSDLKVLILPEIEAENKKIVSANGTIHTYWADRSYGFISDIWKNEVYFNFSEIIDNELLSKLRGSGKNESIPVLFSLKKGGKGDKAIFIHKPKTVEQVAELAKQYFEKEAKPDTALGLVEQILFSFPENYTAIKLRKEIEEKRFKPSTFKPTFKVYDLNYQKAKKLHNIDKNYEEALKYYLLALKNNEKKESCIKDIAMLYVSMGETGKATDFINKYEYELPDSITTYNYLENFYGSVKDFENVLKYTEFLLEERSIMNDKRKNSMYLSKKGFALIQLNELDEARKVLEEAISIHPENTSASRLLQALDEPDSNELSQIKEADFDSLGAGGISNFIKSTINSYNEYYGVPPKIVDSGDFSKETLNAIRRLIDTAGKSRPSERANYLLTEAKLLEQLEPDNNNDLKSVLARFCNAMALNSMYEKHSLDVVRTFYIEAFQLEDNWDSIRRQFTLYLISLSNNHQELINRNSELSGKEISNQIFNEVINRVLNNDRIDYWENILFAFRINPTIANKSLKFIYDNAIIRKKSLEFLVQIGYAANLKITDFDSYSDAWQRAREKRQREYTTWLASLKAISNNENLETLTNILLDSINEVRKSWLTQLDTSRLNIIATDIYDVLATYLRQSGYRDKERSNNFSKAQINQLINEIKEKPTKFSYEGFIPLLEKIELLLEKSFKTVEAASSPKVEISILGEANVLGNDNIVPFQLKVESSKNSSPIRNIKIVIQTTDDITFIEKSNEYFDSIDGGESHIFTLSVKVSNKIANEKATSINITCFYNNRTEDEPIKLEKQLSLRLYSENEFETIPNPYEKLANGGPVTYRSMFYGRNEFIDRITEAIISTDSKQVVIYGQKRSGKSSVLYHLKKSLEDTQKTFCISFSIGEIFENISSATFFHKILFTIEEELENLSFDGIEVPDFKCPSYTELKDTPNSADIFRKYIRNFKRTCQNTSNWQDKKLVVMIDEFTYLYTAIKEGKVSDAIMKQWKAITQNEDATFSSVLVGQDVFPLFKSEFPNEFGVTQDERLTYLSKRDALKLIEEPVWNTKSNKSRYLEDAAEKIIEYTSCNPYYIQIFCARLIKEMNDKKFIEATRSDIKPIADSFLFGGQALTNDKFDNLLNAGEKHDIQRIPQEYSKAVLKKIAEATKFVPYCSREDISIGDKDYEDIILDDLKNREVIEQQGNTYKIQVKLFQEWLLKN
jgi:hypothetical protein